MNLLLDTHTLLWLTEDSPNLSRSARAVITDQADRVRYSVASLWEIVIKVGLKKLQTKRPLDVMFTELESRAPDLRVAVLTPHLLE